jgi:UDP-N-acetylmuramoyl-L-alanyl-D-glutamate--2,6-diaminopimelate ligase
VQGRTGYTWPRVAAITNLSPEHLDYHGTMEQYRSDKATLFRMLRGGGTKVLNRDDETFDVYQQIPSERTIAYSVNGQSEKGSGTLWLTDVEADAGGSRAMLHIAPCQPEERSVSKADAYPLKLPIPGDYNLENALCAIACSQAVGIDILASVRALSEFKGAPGRFEIIDEDQSFTVLVDFTVTPNAYRKTLAAARRLVAPGRRLLVLTGSCGDRMKEKRPEIGRICSELADVVVVSNEDPYTEDPEKTIDDVWAGIDQSRCESRRISDRREAIVWLLSQAQVGDVVLLCGKGADTTMKIGHTQVPWDERAIVRGLLRGPTW